MGSTAAEEELTAVEGGSTAADEESTIADEEHTAENEELMAAEMGSTVAEEQPARETPGLSQRGIARTYLETKWELLHDRPPSDTETGMLSKFIIESAIKGKGLAYMFGEGGKLARQGLPLQDEDEDYDNDAQEEDSAVMSMRRGSLPAPLELEDRLSACMAMDPEPLASPADEPTRRFAAGLTALSPEGRTLSQDFDEAFKSPAFAGPRPGARDVSANQRADSPAPSPAMDEYNESESAPMLLAPLVYEPGPRHASTGLSPNFSQLGVNDQQNDEVSGDQQSEEPPQSTG